VLPVEIPEWGINVPRSLLQNVIRVAKAGVILAEGLRSSSYHCTYNLIVTPRPCLKVIIVHQDSDHARRIIQEGIATIIRRDEVVLLLLFSCP
jgi:hypothetical protein